MRNNAAAGNSTVGTDGRIDEQLSAFVRATMTALEDAGATEDTIEDVEDAAGTLTETLESATIILDEDDVDGEQDQQVGPDEREHTVHTVAVERVLLEYGVSGEQVDALIETIETVDSEVWGSNDE